MFHLHQINWQIINKAAKFVLLYSLKTQKPVFHLHPSFGLKIHQLWIEFAVVLHKLCPGPVNYGQDCNKLYIYGIK